ncbi:glycosyltransferase [uncultured Enterovirga sp.]|uniref:glycosyltransferase n=1 Tax=uncultured Enterovirga sp. TaxID=2026352 RepID=UPI0035CAFD4D
MRVVILADFAEPSGGAQAVAILSALALARLGMAVTYVHGIAAPVDPRLQEAGIDVVSLGLADVWTLPGRKAALAGIWNRLAARRLGEALARLPSGPTILHLHQWTRSLSPSVLPVLLGQSHPAAVTLHDYFMACPNGVYYRFDEGEPCGLVPLSSACLAAPCDPRSSLHKAIRVLRTAATRSAIREARLDVVHVSDRGRDTIVPFLPRGLVQHRIDNPVEAERREAAAIAPDARIAFLGRLTREKGADLVAAAGRDAGMPVLFVGEGPAEAEIRRLNPDAILLGWRSREEVDALLRGGIRAVSAPSRWYETGPLTIYESLAAGVPVVASGRSGAAEKVADGATGFVVEPSIEALAAAFRLLRDDELVARMGRLAHERYWAAPLDPDSHARKLIRLYDGMLAGRPAISQSWAAST